MKQASVTTLFSDAQGIELSEEQSYKGLEEIRSILVKPERDEIKRLQDKIAQLEFRISDEETRAKDTSEVLAKASKLSQDQDERYSDSLKPVLIEQFQNTSRDNSEQMAEALYPILGPAIRKVVANLLSPDSKKSKRTYKFEQLFLIEKESGLPICHAKSDTAVTQDADMVSGMLSAIQSFVKDAFSTKEFDSLDTLQIGELSVWIEWGPEAVIAAVIRGVAPEKTRTALQLLNEDLHSEYADSLANYNGDSEPFNQVKSDFTLFMDNHDSRFRNRVRNLSQKFLRNAAIAAIATFFLIAWMISNSLEKRNWSHFVYTLDAEPGIVVTDALLDEGRYTIRGLKDPLAKDPSVLLRDTSFNSNNVVFDFEPYRAMHPDFALQRLHAVLVPPAGTTLEIQRDTLVITGAESASWIQDAKRLSRQFPEISKVTVVPTAQQAKP